MPPPLDVMPAISQREFEAFQRLIHDAAGIYLSDAKKALVRGRLAKRLAACGLGSYAGYFRLLTSGEAPSELQTAVDLLTTNETYFFREPKHFQFLEAHLLQRKRGLGPFRVWSAATSSGEEAYSVAMLLEDRMSGQWEVIGSDISTRVLETARRGQYPMSRLQHFPPGFLQRFCLKGVGEAAGTLLVAPAVRERVRFLKVNLNEPLPQVGLFDVIFLRNVMIYFSAETRQRVVERVSGVLKPGGYLLIGHSESLSSLDVRLHAVAPSIYRRPP